MAERWVKNWEQWIKALRVLLPIIGGVKNDIFNKRLSDEK
jgi:hypothetical protein